MNLTEEDFDALRDDLNQANEKLSTYRVHINTTFEMFDFLCCAEEKSNTHKIDKDVLVMIITALAPIAGLYSEKEIDEYPYLKKQLLSSLDEFTKFAGKLHKQF